MLSAAAPPSLQSPHARGHRPRSGYFRRSVRCTFFPQHIVTTVLVPSCQSAVYAPQNSINSQRTATTVNCTDETTRVCHRQDDVFADQSIKVSDTDDDDNGFYAGGNACSSRMAYRRRHNSAIVEQCARIVQRPQRKNDALPAVFPRLQHRMF